METNPFPDPDPQPPSVLKPVTRSIYKESLLFIEYIRPKFVPRRWVIYLIPEFFPVHSGTHPSLSLQTDLDWVEYGVEQLPHLPQNRRVRRSHL